MKNYKKCGCGMQKKVNFQASHIMRILFPLCFLSTITMSSAFGVVNYNVYDGHETNEVAHVYSVQSSDLSLIEAPSLIGPTDRQYQDLTVLLNPDTGLYEVWTISNEGTAGSSALFKLDPTASPVITAGNFFLGVAGRDNTNTLLIANDFSGGLTKLEEYETSGLLKRTLYSTSVGHTFQGIRVIDKQLLSESLVESLLSIDINPSDIRDLAFLNVGLTDSTSRIDAFLIPDTGTVLSTDVKTIWTSTGSGSIRMNSDFVVQLEDDAFRLWAVPLDLGSNLTTGIYRGPYTALSTDSGINQADKYALAEFSSIAGTRLAKGLDKLGEDVGETRDPLTLIVSAATNNAPTTGKNTTEHFFYDISDISSPVLKKTQHTQTLDGASPSIIPVQSTAFTTTIIPEIPHGMLGFLSLLLSTVVLGLRYSIFGN